MLKLSFLYFLCVGWNVSDAERHVWEVSSYNLTSTEDAEWIENQQTKVYFSFNGEKIGWCTQECSDLWGEVN